MKYVDIKGSKNSAIPVLFSTLLIENKVVFYNISLSEDVKTAIQILGILGKKIVIYGDKIVIEHVSCMEISKLESCSVILAKIRYSLLLIGIGLAMNKRTIIPYPGGCNFTKRPIDIHMNIFSAVGVKMLEGKNGIQGVLEKTIKHPHVSLELPSVTATENIILFSAIQENKVTIYNAAREPEIVDMCQCLKEYGVCDICGQGTNIITVFGGRKAHDKIIRYSIVPDRIELLSFIALAIALKQEVMIRCRNYKGVQQYKKIFGMMGYDIIFGKEGVFVDAKKKICVENTLKVEALFYPGFPTDGLPILAGLCCGCNVECHFIDNVYSKRFSIVEELRKMGYSISVLNDREYITKNTKKHFDDDKKIYKIDCRDIRCGMGIIIAALAGRKKVVLENCFQVERGYEDIEKKLRLLGADIWVKNNKGYINMSNSEEEE